MSQNLRRLLPNRSCEWCGIEYNPKRKDQRWCSKDCRSHGHRSDSRDYYHQNRDRVLVTTRSYRVVNKQRIRRAKRLYYEQNRNDILRGKRTYYQENLDAIRRYRQDNLDRDREVARAWRQANGEIIRLQGQRRRARVAAVRYRISTADWTRLLRRFNYRCAYCGADGDLHMEHVIPLSRGGRHAIGNILPACPPCNLSKNNKLLIEWRYHKKEMLNLGKSA